MADVETSPPPQLHSPPTSPIRPKGILKNAAPPVQGGARLTWDEENLAATEIDKDSLMKITEPKTPYVRYNAELDTVEGMSEIPPFHLDETGSPVQTGSSLQQQQQAAPPSPGTAATQDQQQQQRPQMAGRQGSVDKSMRRTSFTDKPPSRSSSSSRSASFNRPSDDPNRTSVQNGGLGLEPGEEIEEDEEMDEETAAKHAEFIKARGRHYSNEAEAMKRAQRLMAEDEDDEASGDNDAANANANAQPNGRVG